MVDPPLKIWIRRLEADSSLTHDRNLAFLLIRLT